MVSPKVVVEVGSRLGKVEAVEKQQKQDTQNFLIRVKVAIPISKPIRRGGFLAGSDGKRNWITFKYERLSMFCYLCWLLGHYIWHCARHFALQRNGVEVICKYGDGLRAAGGHPRSPPKRNSSTLMSPYNNKVVVGRPEHTSRRIGTEVEEEHIAVKPTEHDIRGDVSCNKSVTVTDFVEITTENSRVSQTKKDDVGLRSAVTINDNSNSKLGDSLEPNGLNHVQSLKRDGGPQVLKPKPKWTRLIHMECGVGESSKEESKPIRGEKGQSTYGCKVGGWVSGKTRKTK